MKNEMNQSAVAVSVPTPPSNVQMIELSELKESAAHGSAALLNTTNPLHQVKVELRVCVGNASLTVGELMQAKVQQVLVLDRSIQHPVDLVLEGQVVARGQLVAVDDQFAVRITELPLALNLSAATA